MANLLRVLDSNGYIANEITWRKMNNGEGFHMTVRDRSHNVTLKANITSEDLLRLIKAKSAGLTMVPMKSVSVNNDTKSKPIENKYRSILIMEGSDDNVK